MARFATGAVVQLKCGGPPMVVTSERQQESLLVSCEWFVDGDLRRDTFDDVNLTEWSIPVLHIGVHPDLDPAHVAL